MAASEWLFVYGTLRRGVRSPMANWLARNASYGGLATLQGQLFDVGDYPAFSHGANHRFAVTGDLYRLHRPRPLLRKLDRHEGIGPGQPRPFEYQRQCLSVTRADGRRQLAWVYVYARKTSDLRLIPHGDYLHWRRRR